MPPKGLPLAIACARVADDLKAEDIRVWDLRGISSVTDFMVLCTGSSLPQLRAILRDVTARMKDEHGVVATHAEGRADSRWMVVDYIDVMVHIMDPEMRDFYSLETLWKDAPEVSWRDAA
jgi:ribosome-associated protein